MSHRYLQKKKTGSHHTYSYTFNKKNNLHYMRQVCYTEVNKHSTKNRENITYLNRKNVRFLTHCANSSHLNCLEESWYVHSNAFSLAVCIC